MTTTTKVDDLTIHEDSENHESTHYTSGPHRLTLGLVPNTRRGELLGACLDGGHQADRRRMVDSEHKQLTAAYQRVGDSLTDPERETRRLRPGRLWQPLGGGR